MAYSDNTNSTSFYPFYTSGEFDAYSSQASADEQLNFGTFDTPTNGWSVDRQSAYMVDSEPTGLRAEASLESMPSTTPDGAQTYDNGQSSHPENFWPIASQDSQSDHPGIVGRDNSFATSVALEPSVTIPTPSSFPLGYWGDNESGPFTNTFRANVQVPYQPGTGSTRTGMMQTWRFRPYEAPRARSSEHANAEAGPSNSAPPLAPYEAPPPTNPSGGTSEATADAETIKHSTEEDVAPANNKAPPRHGTTSHRAAALEVVKSIRVPVYARSQLKKGTGERTAEGKKAPDAEHNRRNETRELNEELSRYYQLGVNQSVWACPELVLKVLDDIEALPIPSAAPPA